MAAALNPSRKYFFPAFLVLALLLAIIPAHAQAPFTISSNTVSLAVTTTTGRVAVATDNYNNTVRVFNSGTVAVFIACGDVTVTATPTTSMPIVPGTVEVFGCSRGYVAGITASGSATLYLTSGAGL